MATGYDVRRWKRHQTISHRIVFNPAPVASPSPAKGWTLAPAQRNVAAVNRRRVRLRIHRVVGRAAGGSAATDHLGTQGDVWDTQWDMFLAFCGAMLAQLLLARVHNRQLGHQTTDSDQRFHQP